MTWLEKRKTHLVESLLDRTMANDKWKANFPGSKVQYLEMIESDHRPAIIKIQRTTDMGKKMFRYDTLLGKVPEISKVN